MNNDRFKDALWADVERTIIVGGLGGIGSNVIFQLARICNKQTTIIAYDDDIVEAHNTSQFYEMPISEGLHKTTAVHNTLKRLVGNYNPIVNLVCSKITSAYSSSFNADIFGCFDNMVARSIMYNNWVRFTETFSDNTTIFIDGRLNAETFQIFAFTSNDIDSIDNYKKLYLFDDSEVEDAICTLKQTPHVATMIGCLMVGIYTNFLSNLKVGNKRFRKIPFKTTVNIPLMTVTTEEI